MTPEKAIEGIEEVLKLDCHIKYPEWIEALNLGIEALKRVKSQRADKRFMASIPLPGETEE